MPRAQRTLVVNFIEVDDHRVVFSDEDGTQHTLPKDQFLAKYTVIADEQPAPEPAPADEESSDSDPQE